MEFKGTKGKWTIKETKKGHQKISSDDWSDFCKVSNIENANDKYLEVARANALLISKAPEMLAFIIEVMETTTDKIRYDKAKKLINQATEL